MPLHTIDPYQYRPHATSGDFARLRWATTGSIWAARRSRDRRQAPWWRRVTLTLTFFRPAIGSGRSVT